MLKHYYEQFQKWLMVYYRDSVRDPLGEKRRQKFKELFQFKDSGKGKTCFVFANGPSTATLDFNKIRALKQREGWDIFCVNFFINSDFASETTVDYWIISDPRNFDFSDPDSQLSLVNAKRHLNKAIFASSIYLDKIKSKTELPVIAFNDVETSNIFSNNINPLYPRSYLSMSAYKALALALFANYSKIYICGFDNTYIRTLGCNRLNRIYRINEHFDAKAYPNTNPVMELNYKHRSVSDELLAYTRLFSDLRKFKQERIINLDVNSLTDAFEKEDSLDVYKD